MSGFPASKMTEVRNMIDPAKTEARPPAAPSRIVWVPGAWARRAAGRLLLWLERHRQRRALGALSDHMLKDLGLSRGAAGRESGKPFWQS